MNREPKRLEDNTAVWNESKELAAKYNCLSLGEGAPDYMPPKFLVDEMVQAIYDGHNQYVRNQGAVSLVDSVAKVYGPKFERELNPLTEILISEGANGALNTVVNTFMEEGDEIVYFEPCYPMYLDIINLTRVTPKPVALEFNDGTFRFNPNQLKESLS